jgi:hypothetical protein
MQSKYVIRYLWCLWLGYFLGGLLTHVKYESSWPTDIVREVARNHAVAYSKVCWVSFVIVLTITICIAIFNKIKK